MKAPLPMAAEQCNARLSSLPTLHPKPLYRAVTGAMTAGSRGMSVLMSACPGQARRGGLRDLGSAGGTRG